MRLEASHLGQRLTPDGHSSPVIAGFVVAIFPGSSLVLLARIAGIMLVLIGVAELVTAFMARRAAGTGTGAGSTAAPAPA